MVGQSGGPTAVINASLAGIIEAAQESPAIDRVLGMRQGVEGLLNGEIIDLTDLAQDDIERLALTPGAALGSCRRKVTDEDVDALLDILESQNVAMLCYIGGNDSADTTHRLARASQRSGRRLRAIAVPKTIDNDLPETDHCPGYGSVARYVAVSTSESTLDTRSLPTNYPVKIIEVMGRDAGWLAASAGLSRKDESDGPHLIFVPERPFDEDTFLASVSDVHARLGYVIVVVAETVRDSEGKTIATDVAFIDEFGHPILRGTADTLARLVSFNLGLQARTDKPGTLQRSSRLLQSPVDVAEARDVGKEAVRLLVEGQTDAMVTLQRLSDNPYRYGVSSVTLEAIANKQRLLPREFLDKDGTFITDEFRSYATPLLGPDPFPRWLKL